MTDQKSRDEQTAKDPKESPSNSATASGDPGRTPGAAEGDRSTVEESLRNKEQRNR
ncbi:MAG TPA: hypothetical protein VIG62_18150 [Blastocatellia bacterium]|jgi:hypothetical protein